MVLGVDERARHGSWGRGTVPRGRRWNYSGSMNTIHLSDEELEMARHGMTAYLRSFGHDEADTLIVIRAVLARLASAQPSADSSAAVG